MAAMANEVILTTSKDWDDWYEGVQMKAMALNLRKYTDLDAEPKNPPTEPEPYEPNMEHTRPEMVQIHFYIYRQHMEAYKTYTQGVKELYHHISATIDPRLRRALTKTLDPRQILEELKGFIAPTKRQRELDLTGLFLKLSKPSKDCHRLVLKYDVDGFTSEKSNLYRFLNAVQVIHPEFSDFRHQELENALGNGHEPLIFATYQDQSTKESTKKPKRDRCVCGGPHSYIKCWVLNAEERPSKWTPRKEIEEKVKKALENEQIKRSINDVYTKEKKTLAVASLHTQNDENKHSEEVPTLATTTFSTDHATGYQYPL
ncbi:hypothetical protein ACJ72_05884, partial [Emergomyces africanus]